MEGGDAWNRLDGASGLAARLISNTIPKKRDRSLDQSSSSLQNEDKFDQEVADLTQHLSKRMKLIDQDSLEADARLRELGHAAIPSKSFYSALYDALLDRVNHRLDNYDIGWLLRTSVSALLHALFWAMNSLAYQNDLMMGESVYVVDGKWRLHCAKQNMPEFAGIISTYDLDGLELPKKIIESDLKMRQFCAAITFVALRGTSVKNSRYGVVLDTINTTIVEKLWKELPASCQLAALQNMHPYASFQVLLAQWKTYNLEFDLTFLVDYANEEWETTLTQFPTKFIEDIMETIAPINEYIMEPHRSKSLYRRKELLIFVGIDPYSESASVSEAFEMVSRKIVQLLFQYECNMLVHLTAFWWIRMNNWPKEIAKTRLADRGINITERPYTRDEFFV